MDRLFRKFPWIFSYIDDHLVASRTLEEHKLHLRQLFSVLAANGLVINPGKCIFAQPTVTFLGHVVTSTGVSPLPGHIQVVQDFPPPTDVKQLQRFLGVVNFYRRFIPAAAAILRPLTDALAGKPKCLVWTDAMSAAFVAAKSALIAAVPLVHPPGSGCEDFAGRRRVRFPRGWSPSATVSWVLAAPSFLLAETVLCGTEVQCF
jgi:hypothetical protein